MKKFYIWIWYIWVFQEHMKAFCAKNFSVRFCLAIIETEVINVNMKNMLQKLFVKYGVTGANSASIRGCYEAPVPEVLKQQKAPVSQKAKASN